MKYLITLLFCYTSLYAQDYEWLPGGTYDPAVPTPKSVFGYEIGDYLTDNLQMVDYIHKLQVSTNRVKVFEYGMSVERRKLYLLAISSPENIARLEEIRTEIAKLTDPRQTTLAEASNIAQNTVPIGWMNFGTDGGETSAFEAGLQVAYQLAAGTDALTNKILQNTVVIINPALNPDSHQPFVAWMKSSTIAGGTADPNASEHFGEWFISSDGNHYKIDLNRDAFALTQPETQAASKVLHHWNPQVWIDNHGQPNEYYFAPFTSPMNLNYPSSLRKWATEIGKNSAKYFDRFGWTYTKDENYDIYYPGYWDSYPAFNGAIAATYESDGGGSKGFAWKRSDGTIVTLRDAIHHHFIANLATLETLADNRQGILTDFYNFFKTGMDEVDREKYKSFVLTPGNDPERLNDLIQLLLRHNIEIYKVNQALSSKRSETYFDRSPKTRTIIAGSYFIPLKQPQKRLIKTLMEPDPKMEESFLKEVNERRSRDAKLGSLVRKEGHGFYDVTAWALPLTYGVPTFFTEDITSTSGMEQITSNPVSNGGVIGEKAGYAYLISYSSNTGAKLAGKLMQEDYNLALALLPFRNQGKDFPKGTIIARVQRNPESLHQRIKELAKEYEATVYSTNTAWGENGISLGSKYVRPLKNPRIMVLTKQPTRAVAFGSVYSVLTQRYGLKFTAVRTSRFNSTDLSLYNVIIFPDGSPSGYEDFLGENGVEKLKTWINNGGTMIGLKGGAAFTAREDIELTDVKVVREVDEQNDESKPIENLPGSIFRVNINNDYYLGMGYPNEIAVQVRGNYHMTTTKKGVNVATFPSNSAIMGHVWEDSERILANKLYLADVPIGQGHVILFANDPTFRAYWNGLDRLFLSGILFSTAF